MREASRRSMCHTSRGPARPAANFEIGLRCQACCGDWADSLDVAGLVWEEVHARLRQVLGQIHVLVAAYGWTESEILSLSPRRRTLYAKMESG